MTGLARLGGHVVGIIANQPTQLAGTLTPITFEKITRFVCMCDSFNIPLIFLQDCPGVMVGRQVEWDRVLFKGMLLNHALKLTRVPKLCVVLRKSYGLAHLVLGGGMDSGAALLTAWPSAEISFMDPEAAANVLYAPQLEKLSAEERAVETQRLAAEVAKSVDPRGMAGVMGIDELIDPADTPVVLAETVARSMLNFDPLPPSQLSNWPTVF
jgi:acetyl-CoA carboxylase carboxyltransferase component